LFGQTVQDEVINCSISSCYERNPTQPVYERGLKQPKGQFLQKEKNKTHYSDIQTATSRQTNQRINAISTDEQTREALRQPSKHHSMITNAQPLNTRNGIIITGTFHDTSLSMLTFQKIHDRL